MRRALLLLLLVLVAGCAQDATGPELPALLFLPGDSQLSARWGTELVFQVRTATGDPYEVDFSVDGRPLGSTSVLRWRAEPVGRAQVLAVASAGKQMRTWTWSVQVTEEGLDPLGGVRFPKVVRRPVVGSLDVKWSAPLVQTGQPDLVRYEVAWSEGDLPADPFATAAVETLLHRRGVDNYELRLDDLRPGVEHHFLVRAVDSLGRRSPSSPDLHAAPVQSFSLAGRLRRTDPSGLLQPVAGATVRAPEQSRSGLSDADGRFVVEDLVDFLPTPLEVLPPTSEHYPLAASLSRPDLRPEWILLPREQVTVLLSGVPTTWELLTLLRTLSGLASEGAVVARWESFPVDVQVPTEVLANGVDYGAAVRQGISAWNEAAGQQVLRAVDAPPAVGAVSAVDLSDPGGGRLGEVTLLEPAGGLLYRTVPVRVKLALSTYFVSQGICDRVALHELGHVLWLAHSPSSDHLMHAGVSSTSPDRVHPDEARVLRLLQQLPNGTPLDIYRIDP